MSKKEEEYSLRSLEKLYTKLVNQQPFSGVSTVNIPEILNEMGKIIVWGERERGGVENGDIFDFICEVRLFDLLLEIFTKCKSVETINSVIGFYNMLLTNISKPETILYLLSHPCILSMEMTKFGTMANELAEYYINFLKGLSRKIDANTIHIFFNKKYPNFPLIFQTIRFFNHPENLVRTTCRNIILTVFNLAALKNQPQKLIKQSTTEKEQTKIKSENHSDFITQSELLEKKLASIHNYLTSFPFCFYYIHESNFIKEYWKIIDQILEPEGGKSSIYENQQYEIENLDEIISDHEELLIFIDDLLANDTKTENSKESSESQDFSIQDMFLSAFSNQCLSELVMSLCSIKKAFLGIKTSLLILILLLNNLRNKFLSEVLIFLLFSKYYPKSLTHKLLNPVDSLLSYNKEWKFKGFWDGHEEKLNNYCSRMFYSQEKSNLKSDMKNIEDNEKKGKTTSNDTFSVFGTTSNYYDREVEKIEKIFGLNILKFMTPEKGHKVGESIKSARSFSSVFRSFLSEINEINRGHINLNNFDQNPVAANLFSFLQVNLNLFQSKDDCLVMLTLCLLEKAFTIKDLNPEILAFCKLSIKPASHDFSSIMTIQIILLNCVRLFQVDPPNFRICTYKQAAKVFSYYLKLYENKEIEVPLDLIVECKKALKIGVERISPYLYGGKEWEKVVEIYLMIIREKNKQRRKSLRTYGLIPQEALNSGQDNRKGKFTDELYETNAKNFEQQIGRDIWIYVILKDMIEESAPIIGKELKIEIAVKKEANSNKVSKYEEYKSYDLGTDEFFSVMFKKVSEEKYKPAQIILLGGFVVIGVDHTVEYKLPYEESFLIPDKSDPRKLLLQNAQVTLSLLFDQIKNTLLMKENFTESKNLLLKCHLSALIKEIETINSQISFQ